MSSYVAGKMASKKMEGLLAPLLESDDESSTLDSEADSDASTKVETVKQTPMQKLKSLVVYVGLGGGVVASAAAMVLAPAIAIFVMGGICIANVPYAAFKEKGIGKIPSLRAMNNKLREDANNLGDEVDILSEEIDILAPEADRAAAVEEQLRAIADAQSVNVNKLVELVKENEIILAKMRDNLRQRIVQDIISIVVKSDRDNDQTIDRNEAKTLALRIRLQLQEYGVVFDSSKFLKAIGGDTTVQAIIAIVQKLLPAEKKDDDESDDSDSDEEDDVYDMFYMAEDETKGSGVVGARSKLEGGSGVSLMTCDKKKYSRTESIRRKSVAAHAITKPMGPLVSDDHHQRMGC